MTLGLGSVVASAVTTAPGQFLAVIGRHKELVFGAAGVLMALNYWLVVIRPQRCAPGEICHVDSPLMRWNRRVYWISAAIYIGALVLTYGSSLALERM